MRARERNGGYTLMELMVTITAAAIVLGAAATVLLLGLRMNRATGESVKRRQNVRTVLTMVENLAGSGSIGSVETSAESWTVKGTGEAPTTILKWSGGKITAGDGDAASPLLEDVESSAIYWDARSKLLTLAVELDGESYATSVHCRGSEITVKDENELGDDDKSELGWNDKIDTVVDLVKDNTKVANAVQELAGADGRRKLLTVLLLQYGSTGEIRSADSQFTYYSEWYTDSLNYADWPGWNRYTPWCACFLSWGVAQTGDSFNTRPPKFASTGLMLNWFQSRDETYWYGSGGGYEPEPGDYVFFDWDKDGDPDHVGAVLYCGGSNVYTVEGNSGGKVALRRYGKNDDRILGYGVLDWKTAAAETPAG